MSNDEWKREQRQRKIADADYEVGYGKPPASGRFRPGVCPNPRGRGRKRVEPPEAELYKAWLEPVSVNWNGARRNVSPTMIVGRRLREQALTGSMKDMITYLDALDKYGFLDQQRYRAYEEELRQHSEETEMARLRKLLSDFDSDDFEDHRYEREMSDEELARELERLDSEVKRRQSCS